MFMALWCSMKKKRSSLGKNDRRMRYAPSRLMGTCLIRLAPRRPATPVLEASLRATDEKTPLAVSGGVFDSRGW
jgi:hypothetical protein